MSGQQPFFSVILPTYNRAHFIRKSIESVTEQTFSDWELIIVDDGSEDATDDIVASFSDSRIRYHHQANEGRSAARNKGISMSRGRYICFLDSDDHYLNSHLSGLYSRIEELDFPVAFFYTGIQLKTGDTAEKREELPLKGRADIDFIIQAVIGVPQACLHRKILAEHTFNPCIHIGEDMELWSRIVTRYSLHFADQHTVVAVNHSGRSVSVEQNSYKEHLETLRLIFKSEPGKAVSSHVKQKAISDAYFGIARHYLHIHNRLKAIVALLKSIAAQPSHPQTRHKIYLALTQSPFRFFLKNSSKK
jgi:glycosyltransferase involved in cell wall biosynthesis